MPEVLCGILLLAIGYAAGCKRGGGQKPPPGGGMTEEQRERAEALGAQWDAMLYYGGRRRDGK